MMGLRFGEGIQVVPLIAKELAANDVSNFVNVGKAHWVTFLVAVGTVDTATTLTVEGSSANSTNASSNNYAFQYRLSAAASGGTDTWGAITTADSDGFALTATTDNGKNILIDVDPRALVSPHKYLRVVTAATSYSTAGALAVTAFLEPRYGQLDPLTST